MRRINKKLNIKVLGMTAVGIVTAVMIIIFSSIVVRSAQADTAMEKYYAQLECEYKHSVRDYMDRNGYVNAGITVTRVVDAEGNRTYTVKLHHNRLDKLDEDELAGLVYEVSELGFADEFCSFNTVIIR